MSSLDRKQRMQSRGAFAATLSGRVPDGPRKGAARPQTFTALVCGVVFFLIAFALPAVAAGLSEVTVKQGPNELTVTAALSVDDTFIEDLRNGLGKELVLYVDVFRVWKVWPHEFVLGSKITRVLKSDPIKREFVVQTAEAGTAGEKRFKDLDSMIAWATTVGGVTLSGSGRLEPDIYFVRVTAQSITRRLPLAFRWLTPFVPDSEFKVSRDSAHFSLGPVPAPR